MRALACPASLKGVLSAPAAAAALRVDEELRPRVGFQEGLQVLLPDPRVHVALPGEEVQPPPRGPGHVGP